MSINRVVLVGRLTRDPDLRYTTRINHNGYVEAHFPNHHRARGNGYVFEHILIAEKTLGRRLKDNEIVHHINHVKTDNRPSNLMVMDRGEHSKLHSKDRRLGEYLECEHCRKQFYRKPSQIKRARFCSRECNGNTSNIAHVNNKNITKKMLVKALENNNWHKKKAAKELGVHWSTVYRNIKKLGVDCA